MRHKVCKSLITINASRSDNCFLNNTLMRHGVTVLCIGVQPSIFTTDRFLDLIRLLLLRLIKSEILLRLAFSFEIGRIRSIIEIVEKVNTCF